MTFLMTNAPSVDENLLRLTDASGNAGRPAGDAVPRLRGNGVRAG